MKRKSGDDREAGDSGFILLHRAVMDRGFYKEPDYAHLWTHCQMRANHKDTKKLWNGREIIIERGSFITGRHKLAKETGIEPSKVERILKYLESEQEIEQRKYGKNFRIILVKNYARDQKLNSKMNNERTTNEQRMNIDNELNELNNGMNKRGKDAPHRNTVSQKGNTDFEKLPWPAKQDIYRIQKTKKELESKLQKAMKHPSKAYIGGGAMVKVEKIREAIEQADREIQEVFQSCRAKG